MPGMSKSARKATVIMLNQIEIQPPTWKGPVIHKMGVERHPYLIRRLWKSVSPLPPQPGSRCPWPAPSRSASKTRSSCFPEGVGYRRTPMKYKNWTFEGLGLIWNLLNSAIRKPWRQPASQTVLSRWRLGWGRGRQQTHWAAMRPGWGEIRERWRNWKTPPRTLWAAPWRRRQPWRRGWQRWCWQDHDQVKINWHRQPTWPRWPRCPGCSPSSVWGTLYPRRSQSGWPPSVIL